MESFGTVGYGRGVGRGRTKTLYNQNGVKKRSLTQKIIAQNARNALTPPICYNCLHHVTYTNSKEKSYICIIIYFSLGHQIILV